MLKSESFFRGKKETPKPDPLFTSSSLAPSNSSLTKTNIPANAQSSQLGSSTNEVGSKLIVGPNIKLKGVEITDCDTLVVEGRVEATMNSRVIQISEKGTFKGSAEIDLAEVYGEFEGSLAVREKLVIYSTGKVFGKISYGKVVIEEGGQLTGEVQTGLSSSYNSPKPVITKKSLPD
jgi:cytoskeletal protein CcmA (bactofilin family)